MVVNVELDEEEIELEVDMLLAIEFRRKLNDMFVKTNRQDEQMNAFYHEISWICLLCCFLFFFVGVFVWKG